MQQSGASLLENELRRAPFLCAAAGMICGILASNLLHLPQWALVCGAAISAGLWPLMKWRKASLFAYALLMFAAFVFLGITRANLFTDFPANHINSIVQSRMFAQVHAVITSEPKANKFGNYASSEIQLSRIECTDGVFRRAKGKSLLGISIDEGSNLPRKGDTVLIYGTFEQIEPALNPGEFDYLKYLAAKGVQTRCNARSSGIIVLKKAGVNLLDLLRGRVRQALGGDSDSSALLSALLIGERGELTAKQTASFRRSGLMHLLSLSGMHIGLLSAAIWGMLSLSGMRPRPKAIAAALILLAYMLVIPVRSPALRAAICTWVFLAGIAAGRKTSAVNLLALAACITLYIRPLELFSAGWQLSFMCVLGIAVLSSPILTALHMATGFKLAAPAIEMSIPKRVLLRLLQAIAVSVAVTLTAAPLVLYHFSCLYPLSGFNTILLSPLLAITLCLGFFAIIPAAAFPALGFLTTAAEFSAKLFEACAVALARIPGNEIAAGQANGAGIALYYAALFVLFFSLIRFGRLWRWAGLFLLGASIIIAAYPHIADYLEKSLRITVLAVGEGQCTVCEMPDGSTVLFDCGSLDKSELGERVIEPFLKRRGITGKLDVFISHNDSDHYIAAPDLIKTHLVRKVYAPEPIAALPEAISQPREMQYAGCTVQFIRNETGRSDNDRSAVALLEYAGRRIALFADIEKESQLYTAKKIKSGGLKIDVGVLPHHGLLRTLNVEFTRAISPEIWIASCSKRQIARGVYESGASNVLCTAEVGAVSIIINRKGAVEIEPFARRNRAENP
jgi:competence protein ComEC